MGRAHRSLLACTAAAILALGMLTALLAAGAAPAGAAGTPGPAAAHRPADPGCRVHIGDVRVGGYYRYDRSIDAATVGADVRCLAAVRRLSLEVTLWKAGLLYDHEQAQTTSASRAGRQLGNDGAVALCRDHRRSRFYGVAHAVVYYAGRRGDAWARSPGRTTLRCGT